MAKNGLKVTNAGAQVVQPLNQQPKKTGAKVTRGKDLRGGK